MRKTIGKKVVEGAIAVLFVVAIGYPAAANATPLSWTLQNATFIGGGSASGSFTYDATTNQFSNINITTTATSATTPQVFTFGNCCSNILFDTFTAASGSLNGAYFLQIQFAAALTNAGGTDLFQGGNDYLGQCTSAGCATNSFLVDFSGGSVTAAAPTPEPASRLLIPLGLLLVAACFNKYTGRTEQA